MGAKGGSGDRGGNVHPKGESSMVMSGLYAQSEPGGPLINRKCLGQGQFLQLYYYLSS